jgi:hypothetical protein
VTGIDDGLVRQGAKAFERPLKLRAVGKRKVGASHRTGEETIANEGDTIPVYRDVSRRVARHVDNGELQRSDVQNVPVRKLAIGSRGLLDAQTKNQRVLSSAVVDRTLAGVEKDGNRLLTNDTRNSAHMVHVRVRQPNGIELGPIFSNRREQAVGFFTRINQDCPTRGVVHNQVRVFLERPYGERSDDHTAYPPLEVSSGSS